MRSRRLKTRLMQVNVDFGQGIHTLLLPHATYARALAGQRISVDGQGFHWQGGSEPDIWHFNYGAPGCLQIEAENGGIIYLGSLDDVLVWTELLSARA